MDRAARDAHTDVAAVLTEAARRRALHYASALAGGEARTGEDVTALLRDLLQDDFERLTTQGELTAAHNAVLAALASWDVSPGLRDDVRATFEGMYAGFGPAIGEYLTRSGRLPGPATSLLELPRIVGALIEGLLLQSRRDPSMRPDDMARIVVAAITSWTEPMPPGHPQSEAEAHVRDLDRRLADLDPLSEPALRMALELITVAPSSTLAFWRARHRITPLIHTPGIRDTPLGALVWSASAAMLAMADGNRALAEEAAAVALGNDTPDPELDPLGGVRTGWLLVRLERFDDALAHMQRSESLTPPAHRSMLDAFAAAAHCAAGDLQRAVELGVRSAESGHPIGRPFGAALAARALLTLGDREFAERLLARVPPPGSPPNLGATMLRLAHGQLALDAGQPVQALDHLMAVADDLRRVGGANPSGWPWLAPAIEAMMRLDQVDRARRTVQTARSPAERWGTPIVLAELRRAEALLDGAPPARSSPNGAGPATSAALTQLTPRVREVALLVAEGLRDREIAARLHISPRTVHRHVSTALKVTGARTRLELALMVARSDHNSGNG